MADPPGKDLVVLAAEASLLPPPTLERLALLGRYAVHEVPGDIVECGVYRGGSAVVLAQAALLAGRRLWLFDSFAGMPAPEDRDGRYAREFEGEIVASVDEVAGLLDRTGLPREQRVVRAGWFEDTFRDELPDQVALVHIDACWYGSVRASLDVFYDRIPPGGIIVLDDFGFWEGCREAFYDFVAVTGCRPLIERYGVTQAYWVKDRRHNRDGYI